MHEVYVDDEDVLLLRGSRGERGSLIRGGHVDAEDVLLLRGSCGC